jgi:hypothetical protein
MTRRPAALQDEQTVVVPTALPPPGRAEDRAREVHASRARSTLTLPLASGHLLTGRHQLVKPRPQPCGLVSLAELSLLSSPGVPDDPALQSHDPQVALRSCLPEQTSLPVAG